MKSKFLSIVFTLLALAHFFSQSSSKLGNSLLWEVSGNGLQKPSYIFGTFHMMCKDDFELKEKVKSALGKTDQTVLEINMSDPAQMMEMQNYIKGDKKISEQLDATDLQKFEKGLAAYSYKVSDIDELSPLILSSIMTMKYFDCAPTELKMVDMEVMQSTLAAGKKVIGLETISAQAEFFKKFLIPKNLVKMVDDFDRSKADTKEMVALYKNEDLDGLYKKMTESGEMTKEQRKILLQDRNLDWQKKIPELMKANSIFFAVGAGHLPGQYGILKLLSDMGYNVKPIF